ncbi:MAG: hypothetical protein AAFN76_06135 [Pseudomonadota bacterium]
MLIRLVTCLVAAIAVGLFFAHSAEASPRFTVENTTWSKVKVKIYNGDDSLCTVNSKTKRVLWRRSKTLVCYGAGKGRCKVQLSISGKQICGSEKNTCDDKAIKLDGGSTIKVSQTGDEYECEISEHLPS